MKTIKNIVVLLFLGITIGALGQDNPPPPPPAPPAPSTSNSSVITQNGEYAQGGNTSFSVSNSDDEYRVKARYPKNRYSALKEYLMQEMGTKGMEANGSSISWKSENSSARVYEIDLEHSRLRIELDKNIASPELGGKFEDMGAILRTIISGGNTRQNISILERQAEQARLHAERMEREAERLRAMSERDASRMVREAKRLEQEAKRLANISKRGGGIDGYVREVLKQPSTRYQATTSENNGWKWPVLQDALVAELEKNGIIGIGEDIVFIKEDNGIYVNGEKMGPAMWSKYNSLFRKYDYSRIGDVSFYRQGDHIAVINGAVDVEDLLEALEDARLISDTARSSSIEINGTSVVVDGNTLSLENTKKWNTLLHKEHVIPAPGKTININRKSASIGYSFNKSTLGTYISRD